MNMRNIDIQKFIDGKMMTGRPIDFRINTQKWHKVISNRKLGAFGEIFVEKNKMGGCEKYRSDFQ